MINNSGKWIVSAHTVYIIYLNMVPREYSLKILFCRLLVRKTRFGRDDSVEIATVFPWINCIRQTVVDIVRYLNESTQWLGNEIFCWMGKQIRVSHTAICSSRRLAATPQP